MSHAESRYVHHVYNGVNSNVVGNSSASDQREDIARASQAEIRAGGRQRHANQCSRLNVMRAKHHRNVEGENVTFRCAMSM